MVAVAVVERQALTQVLLRRLGEAGKSTRIMPATARIPASAAALAVASAKNTYR